jgi:hypothetical protein
MENVVVVLLLTELLKSPKTRSPPPASARATFPKKYASFAIDPLHGVKNGNGVGTR